ncbi:hypothetical protein Mapa_005508 [Marchantia paleacea]|nr:hypothetical protein Mapa_005508 [Marchantia paleacea]
MGKLCKELGLITLIALVLAISGPWGWGTQGIRGQFQPDGRQGGRTVPAFYIFGDSTADSGNNNEMLTIARANYPPYGRDFDTRHATGRFSNGRMTSDFITDFLRVPIVPPYLSFEAQMYSFQGANFASAGAGILNQTGNILVEDFQRLTHSDVVWLFYELNVHRGPECSVCNALLGVEL